MKTPVTKSVCSILILLAAFTSVQAETFNDTAKNELAGTSRKPLRGSTDLNKSNVEYPVILSGHEKHTLDYIERYANNKKAYVHKMFNKGKKYFPRITAIFKQFNVPQEFKVLIALESGFNGNARSRAGAVGYWQIMKPVAKQYGLKVGQKTTKGKKKKSTVIDERKNFSKSTYAAARYLRDNSRSLKHDYLLIAASYNWGIGNVWNAMDRTGLKNPDFWDIKKYLPSETKAYVMNFIALNVIFHNYEKFAKDELVFQIAPSVTEEVVDECEEECIDLTETPECTEPAFSVTDPLL